MTKKERYKRYSPEFKREALKRTAEEGISDVHVNEEPGETNGYILIPSEKPSPFQLTRV